MRHVIIGYIAKEANKEFSSLKGYILADGRPLPSYRRIREEILDFANEDGGNFSHVQINFINFVSEADYNSFMGVSSA